MSITFPGCLFDLAGRGVNSSQGELLAEGQASGPGWAAPGRQGAEPNATADERPGWLAGSDQGATPSGLDQEGGAWTLRVRYGTVR